MQRFAFQLTALALGAAGLMSCSLPQGSADETPSTASIREELKTSFQPKGQATLDRLDQSPLQEACSALALKPNDEALNKQLDALMVEQMNTVQYPADGQYLGDWKKGEKIAQTGKGKQFSDDPEKPSGGNCYACHQLSPKEIAYGNIGPSLLHYGKLRNYSPEAMKVAWAQIYNSKAFHACSTMPRFGEQGILTQAQIKDVMALLFDPKSPVNQ